MSSIFSGIFEKIAPPAGGAKLSGFGAGLQNMVQRQQGGTHDGGGHGVGDAGGQALLKDLIHGLGIEQQFQHRGHACPADHVDSNLAQVEPHEALPVFAGVLEPQDLGQDAHQTAEGGGGQDPAPAQLAIGQVDEDMAQQAGQSAGQGAEGHGQEAQKTILHADVHRLNGAVDGDEPAQKEEQQSAGGDGGGPLQSQIFHGKPPDKHCKTCLSYPFLYGKSIDLICAGICHTGR